MKLELQIIKLNEDVITTSLCEFYTLKLPFGIKAAAHIHYTKGDKSSYSYSYKDGSLVWSGKYGPQQQETGWYHWDTDAVEYVKCSVGDEGHPHIDNPE